MKEFGDDAAPLAAKRADAMLELGDTDGFTTWLKVVKANETLNRGPADGEKIN